MTNLKSLDIGNYRSPKNGYDSNFSFDDFPDFINDETIAHFANLRYLKINKVNNAIFESLKKLSHLKEIEIVGRRHTRSLFNLPDYLKELEIMTLRQSLAQRMEWIFMSFNNDINTWDFVGSMKIEFIMKVLFQRIVMCQMAEANLKLYVADIV